MSLAYSSNTNTTSLEGVDTIESTDIECDNLVVNDTVSLPNLSITDNEIISVSGNKIIDGLYIDNIYEKTTSAGIRIHNNLILRDAYDQFDISIHTPSLTTNKYVYFPPLTNTTDTFVFVQQAQTLTNKTLTSPIISTIVNTGTLTLPTSTDTLVGRATTDTLTNKTLTSPIISTIVNTGTLTLPTSTDTLIGRATTDTLTNKTLTSPIISTISNTGTLTLPTSTDTLIGRATTDTLTNKTMDGNSNTFTNLPFSGVTGTHHLVTLTGTQTLTNKTLTAPIISTISNSGILTLPTSTDTLVGRNTTDTLTNKVLSYNTSVGFYNASANFQAIPNNSFLDTLVSKNSTDILTNKTLTSPIISTIVNTGTLTLPTSTDTLVGRATTDTLTNKTISGASNTISNVPDSALSSEVVLKTATQTLTNKTLTTPFISTPTLMDGTDTTKRVQISMTPITSGVTQIWQFPNTASTFVGTDATQTLTNKTLTFPTISSFYNAGANVISVPNVAADTITLNAASQTLTNKTITSMAFSGTHTSTFNTSGLNYNSNTTDATSTTSNSAIRTDGGISCAKNIYALNLYGRNLTTAWHVIRLNNSASQTVSTGAQTRLVLNTTEYNPSSMTTTLTAGNYHCTINKTGKYDVVASSYAMLNAGTGSFQGLYLYTSGTILQATEFRFTSQISVHLAWSGILTSGNTVYLEGTISGTTPKFGLTAAIPYTKTQLSIMYIGD